MRPHVGTSYQPTRPGKAINVARHRFRVQIFFMLSSYSKTITKSFQVRSIAMSGQSKSISEQAKEAFTHVSEKVHDLTDSAKAKVCEGSLRDRP